MNFMKKKSNFGLFITIIVICLLIGIFIWVDIKRRKPEVFIYFPNHYALVNSDTIELEILSSQKSSPYLISSNISRAEIYDEDTNDSFVVELAKTESGNKITYENDFFYPTLLEIKLPFSSSSVIKMPNAYLRLSYLNGEIKEFSIGSLIMQWSNSQKAFLINKMKGIITMFDEIQTIGGVILNLLNLEDNLITIEKITLISAVAKTNYDYLKILETDDFNIHTPIDELTNSHFNLLAPSQSTHCLITYEAFKEHTLFVPFTYYQKTSLSQIGFIIDYVVNGIKYQQVIEPILLFQNYKMKERIINAN